MGSRIPHDKLLHFFYGQLVAILALPLGLWWSLVLTLGVALGKEIWDHLNPPHRFDIWDIVWTLLGGIPIWMMSKPSILFLQGAICTRMN